MVEDEIIQLITEGNIKAGTYQCGTFLSAWVTTIAKNIPFDYYKKVRNVTPNDDIS